MGYFFLSCDHFTEVSSYRYVSGEKLSQEVSVWDFAQKRSHATYHILKIAVKMNMYCRDNSEKSTPFLSLY